jgi:hypothetical protein
MLNKPDRSIAEIATEVQPTYGVQEEVMETNPSRGMNWFMILIITVAMIPWVSGDYEILGFSIIGWFWVIPMTAAGLICLGNIGRITFPVGLWLTWVGILCLYWLVGRQNPDALQSLLQLLSPLAVGCATSSFRFDSLQLESVIRWITRLAWIVWILLLIRMPLILTGVLPGHSFMAAEMIELLLLGACYASFYACGSGRHLYYYLAVLAITAISLVRGPIIAMLSCLPLTPAPLTIRKRILLCVGITICALILFNTDRVQKIMFFSGSGELTDLYWDNPNLQTSGRNAMFDTLGPGVEDSPLLGNGFNTHRTALLNAGIRLYLPHNDWLKLLYDMGILGAGIYLITMVLQMFFLLGFARRYAGAHQMLAYAAATAFVPYALIMLTDNVILYVQFFGNLHFALIGIVYGVCERDKKIRNV